MTLKRRRMVWQLTLRLTDAGPMMSDCQPRRDPGVRCSRFVSPRLRHTLRLLVNQVVTTASRTKPTASNNACNRKSCAAESATDNKTSLGTWASRYSDPSFIKPNAAREPTTKNATAKYARHNQSAASWSRVICLMADKQANKKLTDDEERAKDNRIGTCG